MVSGRRPCDVAVLDLSLSVSAPEGGDDATAAGDRLKGICDLSEFTRLKVLDLSGNAVGPDIDEGMMQSLAGTLEELLLARNGIKSVDGVAPLRNLRRLDVSGNLIRSLPAHAFERLSALEYADLSGNGIRGLSEVKHLRGCLNLLSVRLEGNPCAALPQYRAAVIHALPTICTLDGIDVSEQERARALQKFAAASSSSGASSPAMIQVKNKLDRVRKNAQRAKDSAEGENERLRSELEAKSQLLEAKTREWIAAQAQLASLRHAVAFYKIDHPSAGSEPAPHESENSCAKQDASQSQSPSQLVRAPMPEKRHPSVVEKAVQATIPSSTRVDASEREKRSAFYTPRRPFPANATAHLPEQVQRKLAQVDSWREKKLSGMAATEARISNQRNAASENVRDLSAEIELARGRVAELDSDLKRLDVRNHSHDTDELKLRLADVLRVMDRLQALGRSLERKESAIKGILVAKTERLAGTPTQDDASTHLHAYECACANANAAFRAASALESSLATHLEDFGCADATIAPSEEWAANNDDAMRGPHSNVPAYTIFDSAITSLAANLEATQRSAAHVARTVAQYEKTCAEIEERVAHARPMRGESTEDQLGEWLSLRDGRCAPGSSLRQSALREALHVERSGLLVLEARLAKTQAECSVCEARLAEARFEAGNIEARAADGKFAILLSFTSSNPPIACASSSSMGAAPSSPVKQNTEHSSVHQVAAEQASEQVEKTPPRTEEAQASKTLPPTREDEFRLERKALYEQLVTDAHEAAKCLGYLVDTYQRPLCRSALLSASDLSKIFCNLMDIRNLFDEMVDNMIKRQGARGPNARQILYVIESRSAKLGEAYANFVESMDESFAIVKHCAGSHASFSSFLQVAEEELVGSELGHLATQIDAFGEFRVAGYLMFSPLAHARNLIKALHSLTRLTSSHTSSEIVRRIQAAQETVAGALGNFVSNHYDSCEILSRARGKAGLLRLAPAVYPNIVDGRCRELSTRNLAQTKCSHLWKLVESFDASLAFDSSSYLSLPPPTRREKDSGRRFVTCFVYAHCIVVASRPSEWFRTFESENPPLQVLFVLALTPCTSISEGSMTTALRIKSGKKSFCFFFETATAASDTRKAIYGLVCDLGGVRQEEESNQREAFPSPPAAPQENTPVDGMFPGMDMVRRRKLAEEMKTARDQWNHTFKVTPTKSRTARIEDLVGSYRSPSAQNFSETLRSSRSSPSPSSLNASRDRISVGKNSISFHSDTSDAAQQKSLGRKIRSQERLGFGSSSTTHRSRQHADNVRHSYGIRSRSVLETPEKLPTSNDRFDPSSPHHPFGEPGSNAKAAVDLSIFKSPRPKGGECDPDLEEYPSRRRYIGLKWTESEYVKQRHIIEETRSKKPGKAATASTGILLG